MNSVNGMANVLALAAAVFGTPPAYDLTFRYIAAYARHYYGSGAVEFFGFCWMILLVLFLFFAARMSVSTLLVVGGIAVAVRFL